MVKVVAASSFVLCLSNICLSQSFSNKEPLIAVYKQNILLIGIDNPIKISTGSYDRVVVTMNEGTIQRISKDEFIARTGHCCNAVIKLIGFKKKVVNGKSIVSKREFEYDFRVRAIPGPTLAVAGPTNEDDAIVNFKQTTGVVAFLRDFYYDVDFKVDSFDVVFNGGGFEKEKRHRNAGDTWDEETQTLINTSSSGTWITIENAAIIGPDGKRFHLRGQLKFYIR
jgi:hypothetical protein